MTEIDKWDTFYVIVGGAAGALIGLQFVVITLIADRPPPRVGEAGAAFATPTIVHFSAVLLLAALLRAPWDMPLEAAFPSGLVGLAGVFYALLTARRMRRQTVYKPDLEDWLAHIVLPFAAYALLAASAAALSSHEREALFGIGAATLLLLFVAIHNAWDAASYHVLVQRDRDR
jgi:hypothetical protein